MLNIFIKGRAAFMVIQSSSDTKVHLRCSGRMANDWEQNPNKFFVSYKGRSFGVIFGLRGSTLTATVRMMPDIGELDLEIKGFVAKTVYRLVCRNEWVGNGTGHSTI